jgi:hypothetical protein
MLMRAFRARRWSHVQRVRTIRSGRSSSAVTQHVRFFAFAVAGLSRGSQAGFMPSITKSWRPIPSVPALGRRAAHGLIGGVAHFIGPVVGAVT